VVLPFVSLSLADKLWNEEVWANVRCLDLTAEEDGTCIPVESIRYISSRNSLRRVNEIRVIIPRRLKSQPLIEAISSLLVRCGKTLEHIFMYAHRDLYFFRLFLSLLIFYEHL
jgi:hypothetical protein